MKVLDSEFTVYQSSSLKLRIEPSVLVGRYYPKLVNSAQKSVLITVELQKITFYGEIKNTLRVQMFILARR